MNQKRTSLSLGSIIIWTVFLSVFLLAGCGGGGGSGGAGGQRPESARFPIDDGTYGLGIHGMRDLARPGASRAKHMPVLSGAEFVFDPSRDAYTIGGDERLHVGVHSQAAGDLAMAGSRGDTQIRHGTVNDGVGSQAVSDYLEGVHDFTGRDVHKYDQPPSIRIIGDATDYEIDSVIRAVQMVNTALPEGSKLTVEPVPANPHPSLLHHFRSDGTYDLHPDFTINGVVQIEFSDEPLRAFGLAAGHSSDGWGYIRMDRNRRNFQLDSALITVISHELIHTITEFGHYDGIDTIMGTTASYNLLRPADREALRALYMRLDNGDDPTSFGPWESSALYVHGSTVHASFGVAMRNGYFEPWADGYAPDTDLSDNAALAGTVSWDGTLVGLTPGANAVVGDAEIRVGLSSMTGTASFTNLENWGANAAPGAAGTGTTWLDGDLQYSISVDRNTFHETGGDGGRLTGVFVGAGHEGATGVLERTDLTGAFGATR